MNKKDVLITIGICAIGWAAFPIILKLVEKRRKRKENGSEDASNCMGQEIIKAENPS